MKLTTVFVILSVFVCSVLAQTELTDATFDGAVSGDKDVFVKFYAPWCGHCKRLAPDWKSLAENFAGNPKVEVAKIDCTVHRDTCGKHGVRGYPTLKYFKSGSSEGEKYQGGRKLMDLKEFVEKSIEV